MSTFNMKDGPFKDGDYVHISESPHAHGSANVSANLSGEGIVRSQFYKGFPAPIEEGWKRGKYGHYVALDGLFSLVNGSAEILAEAIRFRASEIFPSAEKPDVCSPQLTEIEYLSGGVWKRYSRTRVSVESVLETGLSHADMVHFLQILSR
jgi:hypothetical protein